MQVEPDPIIAEAVCRILGAAAVKNGGAIVATAAELHAIGAGPGPIWPQTSAELEAFVLPAIARRPPSAGPNVHALPGRLWGVRCAALPSAIPLTA